MERFEGEEGETGEFWSLIAAKKTQNGDSDIYDFLGFNKDKIISEVEKYTGKKRDSTTKDDPKSTKKKGGSKVDYIPFSGTDAASFFGSLGAEPEQQSAPNDDDQ